MTKKSVIFTIAIFGFSGLAVFGYPMGLWVDILESIRKVTIVSARPEDQLKTNRGERGFYETGSPSKEQAVVPDYVIYESVFRDTIAFNQLAKSQIEKGEVLSGLSIYFENEAGLTADESHRMRQAAGKWRLELNSIDEEAEIIIKRLREQHQSDFGNAEKLIEPTPDLLELQERRNQLALYHMNEFHKSIDEQKLTQFQAFIQGRYRTGISLSQLSSLEIVSIERSSK